MPYIVSAALGVLIQLAGSLVGRVLLALGFGFVEFVGLKTLVGYIFTSIKGSMVALSPSMLAWAGFFRLDVHISIIASAITMKLLLNSMNTDRFRKLAPNAK